jgi:poly-gamma-glutamate capsule biosynthesis protein CapA/YwtB (metallophosphatase superfamily)
VIRPLIILGVVLASLGAPAAVSAKGAVSLVWGGDVTLGSRYGLPPDRGWPQLAAVAPVLRGSDLAAVNYEGTFGSGGASKCGGSDSATCFSFQAPPRNTRTLARAGVDIVNTANNHAFDFGPSGQRATRGALAGAGVMATGAPGELRVLRRNGTRVAFVGFSTYRWSAPMSDESAVRSLVARAARRADIVVVFMHAGAEGADKTHVPGGREHAFGEDRGDSRRFAHVAVDAGADVVLGSGPHVLRGLQIYRGRLIAYSLGNLTGWHNFATSGTLSYSALLRVELASDGRITRGRVTSLRLDGTGVPHRDSSGGAAGLMRGLSSDDFGAASAWAARVGRLTGPPLLNPAVAQP